MRIARILPKEWTLSISPRVSRYISDHTAVLCSIRSDKPSLTARNVSFRKLHLVNAESLNEDLASSELCKNPSDDLQELVTYYNQSYDTLKAALDASICSVINDKDHRPDT